MEPPAKCDHCTETAGNSSAAVDRETTTGISPEPEQHPTAMTSHNLLKCVSFYLSCVLLYGPSKMSDQEPVEGKNNSFTLCNCEELT